MYFFRRADEIKAQALQQDRMVKAALRDVRVAERIQRSRRSIRVTQAILRQLRKTA